ncbi:MAG: hypothetical protein ABFS42_12770 [Candidatus Krumholzibacteriota bacterium]
MIKSAILSICICLLAASAGAEVAVFDLQLSGALSDTFEIEIEGAVDSVGPISFSATGDVESAIYRCTTYDWETGDSWFWEAPLNYELNIFMVEDGTVASGFYYFTTDGHFVIENAPIYCTSGCDEALADGRLQVIVAPYRDLPPVDQCPGGTETVSGGNLSFDNNMVNLTIEYNLVVPTTHETWGKVKARYR